ncbi:MATE family efflux transporter [Clostridium formicaceticum]|uniref:MATE family efflux transporter n=1 Tax=Clostridium formicaceticum TaxID=1497 RepID=A0AAC9WH27_9CLOT|nr:MATE family efflux transporter [Clostridium formicaceticum]AOY76815.1 MATE family efflux transporter [Clostridium formicaceticum]ARE87285.1 Multidrug export protein MepA [Clostridium formicaceticum]
MREVLNKKDSKRRKFVLEGDMWQVVLSLSLPLAVYNGFNHLFGFLDTMMAAHIGSEVVSAIAYLSQIKTMIAAIGAGLAVGGGIIVARYYGAGDIKNAKKYVNTLLFLAISIGVILLAFMLPFIKPILRMANTPEELIYVGSNYFAVEIIMIIAIFINSVYIAVEKAKGNTKIILHLNLMVLGIKLILTSLFVYVFNFGITMMAIATLLAHLSLTIIGISNMLRADNVFRLSLKSIDLSPKTLWPIINLALPIFFEKFTFSFGKVIVNSMSTLYGSMVVGALGISNNVAGIATSVANGFQDGEASIISQNLGNKNFDRALEAFKKTLIVCLAIGGIGMLLTGIFIDLIIRIFAKGDLQFAQEIKNILKYEIIALTTLTITSAVMGLLYGFGYTKLTLVINFLRLFLFRIPTLYLLQRFSSLGSESVGIAMMISNGLVGITSIAVCFIVIQKMKREGGNYLILVADS